MRMIGRILAWLRIFIGSTLVACVLSPIQAQEAKSAPARPWMHKALSPDERATLVSSR